jgi:hypothetical protein
MRLAESLQILVPGILPRTGGEGKLAVAVGRTQAKRGGEAPRKHINKHIKFSRHFTNKN